MRRSLRWLLLPLLGLAGCRDAELRRLSAAEVETLDRHRARLDTSTIETLRTSVVLRADSGGRHSFDEPASVAFSGWPACEIIVADAGDVAVHVLDVGGRLVRSLPLPADASVYHSIYRASASGDGTIVVSDNSSGWLAVAVRGRLPWRVFTPPRVVKGSRLGSGLALTTDGRIVEHWLSVGFTRPDSGWDRSLPLMRIFDTTGRQVGTLGSVRRFGGATLTARLNRGIPFVVADTLWFLSRADARVSAYPLQQSRERPARQIDLPIAFEMDPPSEFVDHDTNRASQQVDDHATAFTVAASGRFLIGQSTRYWVTGERERATRNVLVVADRDGRTIGVHDLGGVIRGLAATGKQGYALVAKSLTGHAQLVRFTLPSSAAVNPSVRSSDRCKE